MYIGSVFSKTCHAHGFNSNHILINGKKNIWQFLLLCIWSHLQSSKRFWLSSHISSPLLFCVGFSEKCYETLHLRYYDNRETWGRIHLRNVEQCTCVAGEINCERVRYTCKNLLVLIYYMMILSLYMLCKRCGTILNASNPSFRNCAKLSCSSENFSLKSSLTYFLSNRQKVSALLPASQKRFSLLDLSSIVTTTITLPWKKRQIKWLTVTQEWRFRTHPMGP